MTTLCLSNVNSLSPLPAALHYARNGFPVFPLRPGGKTPLVRWREQASFEASVIQSWYTAWPTANLAIPLGNGWFALDLDCKGNGDGWLSYLELGGPEDPPWPRQHTPSGGLHLLIYDPGLARDLSNFSKQGPRGGIDMRVDGGYIAVSPSRFDGRLYQWVDGDPCASVPQALAAALRGFSRRHAARLPGDFPMPEARATNQGEVNAACLALGNPYFDFLVQGVPWTGDASRDAYASALRAFSAGWSLQDMATWGAQTTLATFGAESPHNAPDPWKWCWRYTIREAWEAWEASQRKAPAAGRQSGPAHQEENDESGKAEEVTQPQSVYQLLRDRVQSWDPLTDLTDQVEATVREAVFAHLGEDHLLELLALIKQQANGFTLEILKAKVTRIRREARAQPLVLDSLQDVFVEQQNAVLDRRTGALIRKEAWLVSRTREFDGDENAAKMTYLTGREGRVPVVSHLTYDPRLDHGVVEDQHGVPVYNRYRGSGARPRGRVDPQEIRPWTDLLESLRVEGGSWVREWLLDHVCWWLQRPGVKLNHGLLLGGAMGIGKDSWLAPVLDAVGRHNVTTVEGSQLTGGFSSYLADTKLLVVQEVNLADHRDRHMVAEHLKGVLASPPDTLQVNEKHLRPYNIPNLLQTAMFSNHRHCLQLANGERRYFGVWCQLVIEREVRAQWEDWFAGYWEWLDSGGSDAVGAYLRERPITTIRSRGQRPPTTPWVEDLMQLGRDPLEIWLIEQIDRAEGPFAATFVGMDELLSAINQGSAVHLLGSRTVNAQRLGKALWAVGARRKQKGDRRGRKWILPGRPETEAALREDTERATVLRLEDRLRQRRAHPGRPRNSAPEEPS